MVLIYDVDHLLGYKPEVNTELKILQSGVRSDWTPNFSISLVILSGPHALFDLSDLMAYFISFSVIGES